MMYSKTREDHLALTRAKVMIVFCFGILSLLCIGLLYAWSVFKKFLALQFPDWISSQLSLTFTISMISFGLGGVVSGWLSKAIKPSNRLIISSIMVLVAFVGLSFLPHFDSNTGLFLLYTLYGLICGLAVGIAYNVINISVNQLFIDNNNKGLISGVLLTAFGLSSLFLGTITSKMLYSPRFGFRTFTFLGITISLVLSCTSLVFKRFNLDCRVPATREKDKIEKSLNPREMLRTKIFWFYMVRTLLASAACMVVIENSVPMMSVFSTSVAIGLLVSAMNGFGRIVFGFICDRVGTKKAILYDSIVLGIGSVLLFIAYFSNIYISAVLAFIFIGLAFGGNPTLSFRISFECFGRKNQSINYSLMVFLSTFASFLGPFLCGLIVSGSNNTNLATSIYMCFLSMSSFVFAFFIPKQYDKICNQL